MFAVNNCLVLSFISVILSFTQCHAELALPPPSMYLFSPDMSIPQYTEVIVKHVGENLTLVCEVRGDRKQRTFVWNYLGEQVGNKGKPFIHDPLIDATVHNSSSILVKHNLALSDSGQYICSAPPYSIKRYVLVQPEPLIACAVGGFTCGPRCVLATYLCDGRADCPKGEDEDRSMCPTPCGAEALWCVSGRCVPAAACAGDRGPPCCDMHRRQDGFVEVEYPALFEDRHAPDEYGFIQSTIYTVTACALIFMIAVVLLVSAICKMHMKRAALRNHAVRRYTVQTHRFPPCYEASRLLERDGRASVEISPSRSNPQPVRAATSPSETSECEASSTVANSSTGLARLGALFSSRYRAVPTQPSEVELQNVRCNSLNNSPSRSRNRDLSETYRSPTYCDLNTTDFFFTSPETADCGRELNYMATPLEFFRRRTLNRGDQLSLGDRARPLTLQLGRFQLSIPRFGRRSSNDLDRRPDTPNISEINIDDLDFVRLNENDTYTLNGRTIRLLGANFENYPLGANRPPPYNEAMRYKLCGPPPEYLSRDVLTETTVNNSTPDRDATSNVEMPPQYEDLASGTANTSALLLTDNLPDVQSVINSNERNIVRGTASNSSNVALNHIELNTDGAVSIASNQSVITDGAVNDNASNYTVNQSNDNNDNHLFVTANSVTANAVTVADDQNNVIEVTGSPEHMPLTQIIDNLPAIDSDYNANENIVA